MRHALVALAVALLGAAVGGPSPAFAQANLADGFARLPAGTRILLMPADVELFEISMGGVLEPRADWTADATKYLVEGLRARKLKLGARVSELDDDADESLVELSSLHNAVSRAIVVHHFGSLKLPTKAGKLDWTLGGDTGVVREKTGADFALFTWVRDSYVSDARRAAMVVGALLGVGLASGAQEGYASLVDLKSGRVVWFNYLRRPGGDLRTREQAEETLNALLKNFPG
ncbi:MAG TPA: hypothetical protein VFZ74_02145 [Burkholderiales bacterium]